MAAEVAEANRLAVKVVKAAHLVAEDSEPGRLNRPEPVPPQSMDNTTPTESGLNPEPVNRTTVEAEPAAESIAEPQSAAPEPAAPTAEVQANADAAIPEGVPRHVDDAGQEGSLLVLQPGDGSEGDDNGDAGDASDSDSSSLESF